MQLDAEFVRGQFPQLADDPEFVFCGNAGGSYVARPVLQLLDHYNRHLRVQPYSGFSSSLAAGEAMDRARSGWAQALNVAECELTIGPSTSINTYVLAQALGAEWEAGDEIVVTQQDHESNHGVWRRVAESRDVQVREWRIDPDDGLLNPDELYALLNERTRWVFFTHCSNIVGTANPVAEIAAGIRQRCEAGICVDGVAYAPHHICDLTDLNVDVYLFSLYKVFGPHQGLMYVRESLQRRLSPQCHYFLRDDSHKRFNPSGPQHAQVAGCAGVLDYFRTLHRHHGGGQADSANVMLQQLHGLTAEHEHRLVTPLLEFLAHSPQVRLLGKPHARDGDRAATIAFQPLSRSAADVTVGLHARGIGAEHGHFYAHRLLTHLGIEPAIGVVRLSLVHYNTVLEVERILAALDQVLG